MQYKIGQIVEGKITGIQPYGAFVSLDDKATGLIHISEISDGFVKDISTYVNINDKVRVKIIDYNKKNGQARLSIKALQPKTDRKALRYGSLPEAVIGFKSIEEHMEKWIREAKEND